MKLEEISGTLSLDNAMKMIDAQMGSRMPWDSKNPGADIKPHPQSKLEIEEPSPEAVKKSEEAWADYGKQRAVGKVQGRGTGGKRNWTGD